MEDPLLASNRREFNLVSLELQNHDLEFLIQG